MPGVTPNVFVPVVALRAVVPTNEPLHSWDAVVYVFAW